MYLQTFMYDIFTFNDHYLNPLLDYLSKNANKTTVLLDAFNIKLLNFDKSENISTFLEDLASNLLQPQILLRTRISNNSKTLIENIFFNKPTPLVRIAVSGNISSSISDHLSQYFELPDFFSNSPLTKYNIIFKDWKNFNNQSFFKNFEKINWNQVLELNQDHVNINFENYLLNTVNTLINSYASLKKAEQKTKKSFSKNHGLQKESKIRLKRKIGSLKSTLDVAIVMKIFYGKNINIYKQLINFTKEK